MKLHYIQVIRSLSILIVVFFHVYGYMYATVHFPACREKYYEMYFWANQCVFINIAMPMFTFISGYLFNYLYDKGKYQEFLSFAKKKVLRLWLPYFIFGILMMLTTGVDFKPWKLLMGAYSHLWYLPTLSWCFLLGWLIKSYVRNGILRILFLFFFLFIPMLGEFLPKWMGLANLTVYAGWFLLGGTVSLYEKELREIIYKSHTAILFIIIFITQVFFYPVEYGYWTWYSIIAMLFLLVTLWYFFSGMSSRTLSAASPLIFLSDFSFGIFIFHNWIGPYLVSSTAKRLFPLEQWADAHTVIFPFALALITLGISWFLSWALIQTKVGKYLIG